MSSRLHNLGLNCWLAALIPALLAALACAWLQHASIQAARDGSLVAYREAVAGICAGLISENPQDTNPERWHHLLPRWRLIEVIAYDYQSTETRVLAAWPVQPDISMPDEPDGQLTVKHPIAARVIEGALTGSAAVLADHHVATANLIRDLHLQPQAVLYVESDTPLPPAFSMSRDLPLPLAIIAVGCLLAWYLSARIQRPIADLEHRARAALHGEALSQRPRSSETAEVVSAVDDLATAYRRQVSESVEIATARAQQPDGAAGPES